MTSIASVTRQIAALDINKKTTATKSTLSKQPSQTNVAKLLTKFAAPNPSANSAKPKPTPHSALRHLTTEKPAAPEIDIGSYDGGLELENEKRGAVVSGDAAMELALDSSVARYVS